MARIKLGYTGHSTRGVSAAAVEGLSWRQRTGLRCRPFNDSITESRLLVPSQKLCLILKLTSGFISQIIYLLYSLQEALYYCRSLISHLASCSIIKLLWLCYLALSYALGSIALELCTSIATIRSEGEIIFPRRVTYLIETCGSPNFS